VLNGDQNVWQAISEGHDLIALGSARSQPRVRLVVQLQGVGSAEARQRSLGRRAQPRAHGADVQERRERAAARRADERPRRRYAAHARGGDPQLRGCVVIISHDRWFLDRIATHILAFEGDSQVVWFEGNYQEYEADRNRRLGAEPTSPTASSTES
jgi:hypothetical protein